MVQREHRRSEKKNFYEQVAWSKYIVTAVVAIGATYLRVLLQPFEVEAAPYITIFPTIALVGAVAGAGPAIFAAMICFVLSEKLFFGGFASANKVSQGIRAMAVLLTGGAVGFLTNRLKSEKAWVLEKAAKLEDSEEQFRAFMDNSPVAAWIIDESGRYLYVNPHYYKMFSIGSTDLQGVLLKDIYPPDLAEIYLKDNQAVLKSQTTSHKLMPAKRFNDEPGEVLVSKFILKRSGGAAVLGGVAADVTDLRKNELELRKAKEAAESANAEKVKFLATMSHELRTPLNSILGFADILGEENLEISERIDLAKRVQRNGLVLNKLIGEILDLSKIEAGKLELESMEVNLVEMIKEVLQILSPSAEKKGIELRSEILSSIPTTVITDPTRLRQMLTNLIGNAIKFTTRGFVKVELQVDSIQDKISICIEDSGEGISEENQKKLFEAFVQVDSSHNRQFGGTGLGLSISRKIARAMGGDLVLLKSELNKGSSFLLTFPLQNKLNYMTKHNGGLEQNILPQSGQLTGVRILVADDTTDNLLLAERILTKQGAVVQKASSGQEALKHVSEEDFDLVLMDIQMPEMDGYEATRQLRQRGFKKPILALTAHALSSEKERSLTMGFDDYLVKPVSKKELVAAIIRQLDQ